MLLLLASFLTSIIRFLNRLGHRVFQRPLSTRCFFHIGATGIKELTPALACELKAKHFRLIEGKYRRQHNLTCVLFEEHVRQRRSEKRSIQVEPLRTWNVDFFAFGAKNFDAAFTQYIRHPDWHNSLLIAKSSLAKSKAKLLESSVHQCQS